MIEMYLVGGAVRDRIMGVEPHDYDFTVVAESYEAMKFELDAIGIEIFQERPEFGTIRGRYPRKVKPSFPHLEAWNVERGPWRVVNGHTISSQDGLPPIEQPWTPQYFHDILLDGMAVDFVWARKEGPYSDGRHPDFVEPGSLYDDLARRDQTMNAIAMDSKGLYIDPFGGQKDIEDQIIRAVGSPKDRLIEDALRAVRVIRFAVTKGFEIDPELGAALSHVQVLYNLEHNIAIERVREELEKAMKHDTIHTLDVLNEFKQLRRVVFRGELWLQPSLSH